MDNLTTFQIILLVAAFIDVAFIITDSELAIFFVFALALKIPGLIEVHNILFK
jgi:hypothetical protein